MISFSLRERVFCESFFGNRVLPDILLVFSHFMFQKEASVAKQLETLAERETKLTELEKQLKTPQVPPPLAEQLTTTPPPPTLIRYSPVAVCPPDATTASYTPTPIPLLTLQIAKTLEEDLKVSSDEDLKTEEQVSLLSLFLI